MSEPLSREECRAWAERFGSTPFTMLALAVAVEGQPGPMEVMRSLFFHVAALEARLGVSETQRDRARDICATAEKFLHAFDDVGAGFTGEAKRRALERRQVALEDLRDALAVLARGGGQQETEQ